MKQLPKRLAKWFAASCVIVGLLAFGSSLFHEDWTGAGPFGEFRVVVQDEQGRPIPDAVLKWHFSDSAAPLDEQGRIVITETRPHRFGGSRWNLFWVIPMGTQPPEYVWEVSAGGFRSHRVDRAELSKSRQSTLEPTVMRPHLDGEGMVELRVYDVVVTLKR